MKPMPRKYRVLYMGTRLFPPDLTSKIRCALYAGAHNTQGSTVCKMQGFHDAANISHRKGRAYDHLLEQQKNMGLLSLKEVWFIGYQFCFHSFFPFFPIFPSTYEDDFA